MSESKPFASLSGSLLARKGQAAPAMRRQNMMVQPGSAPAPESLEDLGWNDMGLDFGEANPTAGRAGLSPMGPSPVVAEPVAPAEVEAEVPLVVQQQRVLVDEFKVREEIADVRPIQPDVHIDPVVVPMPKPAQALPRAAAGSRGKAAFTLRLDPDRHLSLRLVCALRHRSAQQVVTEALDAYLAKQDLPANLSSNQFSASA